MYILRRRSGLMSLKVAFASVPGDLKIDYTLERFEKEELIFQKAWRRDVTAMPAPATAGMPPLPTALPDGLGEVIRAAQTCRDSRGVSQSEPLWLHLVKPYGMLGIVRWEQVLTEALSRPVFRLPDFLAKPCELTDVLECAILWDHRADAVDEALLHGVIGSWLDGSERAAVRVHVLATDPHVQAGLAEHWRQRSDAVVIHRRETAPDLVVSCGHVPAFTWLEQAMQGVALDALQIAADAELDEVRSTLMLTGSSPEGPVCPAGVADLATLLNRLGAWCTIVSGMSGDAVEPALRHFADALAQARPGPVMFHAMTAGRDEDLLTACTILFSAAERDPLPLTEGFLYCTPALVSADAVKQVASAVPGAPVNDLLSNPWPSADIASRTAGTPPPWIAASQRVVEEIALDHSRNVAGDNLLQNLLQQAPQIARSLSDTRGTDAVQQAIDDIQSIIRHAAVKGMAADREGRS